MSIEITFMLNTKLLFTISFFFAIITVLSSFIWIYWFALIFGLPAGLISYFTWLRIKDQPLPFINLIPKMLISAIIISIVIILYWIIKIA